MPRRKLQLSKSGQELVRNILIKCKLTQDEFAKDAGFTRQLLSKFMQGELVEKNKFDLIYNKFEDTCKEVGLKWKNDVIVLGEEDTFPANTTTEPVDVIFFYNKEDESQVEDIAKWLDREGIRMWIAAWHLPPGHCWQTSVEPYIKQANSVAVFISGDGGPWRDKEQLDILNKFYKTMKVDKREISIIPVLIKDARPEDLVQEVVPRYLKNNKFVDFSQGISANNIDNLIWGITKSKPTKKQRFLTIFSHDDKYAETDKSTVIVLPQFEMDTSLNQAETPKQAAIENLRISGNTKTSNFSDTTAFSRIISLFQRNFLPLPQLMGDQDNTFFTNLERKIYILIGLSNNKLYTFKDKSIPAKYFECGEENRLFFIKCGRFKDSNELYEDEEWTLYKEEQDKEYDYALFAKFEYDSKKIIVCGGITETATKELAEYINQQWEYIYYRLGTIKGKTLDPNDSFAVVIKIPKNESEDKKIKIQQICIKPVT